MTRHLSHHNPLRVLYVLTVVVAGLMLLLPGCAATSNAITDEEIVTNQKPMSTYTALLVKDFELKPGLYGRSGDEAGEREQLYASLPGKLTEQVIRYLRSRNIYKSVTTTGKISPTTLVLKGKFVRVGRFRISIEALLVDGGTGQEVAYCRQTLWDVLDTTEGIGRLAREVADFIDRIQYK